MDYGVIGEHLKHSFSREIHEAMASYSYCIKEIPPDTLGEFITSACYKGLNVTIPYKKAVMPYLDVIDPVAEEIGAVNTIVNRNGKLYGYNTDFFGLSELIKRAGIALRGEKVLILGTGGTSFTARAVATSMGAREIYRVSRRPSEDAISYEQAYAEHYDAAVIINTTPVGMFPYTEDSPIDIDRFPRCCGVVDAVYNPLRTTFVLKAREKGLKATCGLYMLVAQAAKSCSLFLDDERVLDCIETIYGNIHAMKENIVLIGMPGCGKSTVGKLLSCEMGRSFVDSDDEIVRKAGKSIPAIFAESGEVAFRQLEQQVIAELADRNGHIIATGGGAVLARDNVFRLRKNGRLFFLDRPLEELMPTNDRPLSNDWESLEKRYCERLPLYKAYADETVPGGTPKEAVEIIMRMWQ